MRSWDSSTPGNFGNSGGPDWGARATALVSAALFGPRPVLGLWGCLVYAGKRGRNRLARASVTAFFGVGELTGTAARRCCSSGAPAYAPGCMGSGPRVGATCYSVGRAGGGGGGGFGGRRTASSAVLAAGNWVGGLACVGATRGGWLTASAMRRRTSASVRGGRFATGAPRGWAVSPAGPPPGSHAGYIP